MDQKEEEEVMSRNYMKEAIDILESHPDKHHSIITQILKDRPSAIVKSYRLIEVQNVSWMPDVLRIMRAGHKIAAIKQLRAVTRMGLQEAKEEIEKLQDSYNIKFT